MRLIAATVRNYRVHREVTVEFDPARTLIGGPNESGKSTFIEAVHRALFLKAQVTGEPQRSMVSRTHPGHPEVEVDFEIDGTCYHLFKRFGGQSGVARLTLVGGRTWLNEEAETVLHGLLGVPEVGGGRGVADRARRQWAHLWVWQGTSSDDPCQSAREQNDLLLKELQRRGGAVVMQSELDARVAAWFAEAADRAFVGSGRPRAGSPLDQAAKELTKAEAARDLAADRLATLRQAIDQFMEAETTIARAVNELAEIERQLGPVKEALALGARLQEEERDRKQVLERAVERLTELQRIEEEVRKVRAELCEARELLEPQQAELREAEAEHSLVTGQREKAWEVFEAATAASRRAQRGRALASAIASRFDLADQCVELENTLSRIHALEEEIGNARHDLGRLPPVDDELIERIRGLESEVAQSKAALTGVAAEIELVTASLGVSIDGQTLLPGASRTVTEPAEVRVGDIVSLRIRPGGGAELGRARDRARGAAAALRGALEAVGVESVQAASDAWGLARGLRSEIERAQAALDALTPEDEDPAARLVKAKKDLAAADVEVQRLTALIPEAHVPATRSACRLWLNEQEERLRRAEAEESEAEARWEALKARHEKIAAQSGDMREAVAGLQSQVVGLEARERYLLEVHGDDVSREKSLTTAGDDRNAAEAALEEVRNRLEALQVPRLEADQERLERARREAEGRQMGATTAREVARSKLGTEGTDDPYADLAFAEAQLASARERHDRVRHRAEAVRLVDKLFAEEQRALSEELSRPLAETIESYVQCLFGPEARVILEFDESGVTGIELIRPGERGTTGFDDLSEGTREQVAGAVRLAVAELLAAGGEAGSGGVTGRSPKDRVGSGLVDARSLPVVFDDAFAYSDPERVPTLQRMLDLAAARGIQVIVLTCNPSDYALLGAHQVLLPSPL